jgi:arginase family enzyme
MIERAAGRVAGLDIYELTPFYDRGQTALLAARMAREFVQAKAKQAV